MSITFLLKEGIIQKMPWQHDMLNNMVASFTASNQIGEAMKGSKKKKVDTDNSTDEENS